MDTRYFAQSVLIIRGPTVLASGNKVVTSAVCQFLYETKYDFDSLFLYFVVP